MKRVVGMSPKATFNTTYCRVLRSVDGPKVVEANLPAVNRFQRINSIERQIEICKNNKQASIKALSPIKQTNKKQMLETYELKEKIGEGAFAEVRLGFDKAKSKNVVIKIYDKYKLYDKQRKANISNQVSILKKISHPNIITLHDTVENSKSINLIMQYFSVKSLRRLSEQSTNLQQQQIRRIIQGLADALQYLHSNGIAHRDIKLENVLVDSKLNIKLIDFGFSIDNENSDLNSLVGTPSYLCPEIINKKDYDPYKADVWALGVLFYYLTFKYFPFRGDSKALYKKITKGELLFAQGVNPGCEYLIRKMLDPNPVERISAEDILKDTWVKPVNFKERINLLMNTTCR